MEYCYEYSSIQKLAIICILKFITNSSQNINSKLSSDIMTKLENVLLRAMQRHPYSKRLFINCLSVLYRSNLLEVCTL